MYFNTSQLIRHKMLSTISILYTQLHQEKIATTKFWNLYWFDIELREY